MTRLEKIDSQLQSTPNDPFLNYCRAMELAKLKDLSAAREAFQRVQQLDERDVASFFQEGQMLANSGDTVEARRVLETGIVRARKVGNDHALGEMVGFLDTL